MSNLDNFLSSLTILAPTDNFTITDSQGTYVINVDDFRTHFNIIPARVEYVNVPLLNIRSDHSIHASIVGELKFGDLINILPVVPVQEDGHTWQKIQQGWIAGDLTTIVKPPAPTVNIKKFGMNVLTGDDNLINSAARLMRNGTPIASLTVVDDIAFANHISPSIPLINLRFYIDENGSDAEPKYDQNYDSAFNAGYNFVINNLHLLQYVNRTAPVNNYTPISNLYPTGEHKILIQFTNEMGYQEFDWAFFYGIGKALENQGLRGVLFNDGVGHPEPDQMSHRASQVVENGKTLFQWMNDNGHVYGLHCYSDPNGQPGDNNPYYSTRYNELFGGLLTKPQVLISETGQFNPQYKNPTDFVSEVDGYNKLLDLADFIIAANWWVYKTGGDDKWNAGDFSSALPQIEKYLSS